MPKCVSYAFAFMRFSIDSHALAHTIFAAFVASHILASKQHAFNQCGSGKTSRGKMAKTTMNQMAAWASTQKVHFITLNSE
ncbi:MAG: hypothetical protein EGQ84_08045 [Slackia sp.]|nr:hypothetical protein [Slackia sp.]